MIPTKNTLSFTTTDTNLTFTLFENGFIKSIVLVLPNFTGPAANVSQIDVMDEDGNVIYTNSTGWAENTTHLISSISVPISNDYTLKVTLDGAAGGAHDVVVRTYINTQE